MKKFSVCLEKYSLIDRFQHELQIIEAEDLIDLKNRYIRPWIEQNVKSTVLDYELSQLETTSNNKLPSFMYERSTRINMIKTNDINAVLYTATYNDIGNGLYIHKPHQFYLTRDILCKLMNHSMLSDEIKVCGPSTVEFLADMDTESNTFIRLSLDEEVQFKHVMFFAKHDRIFKYKDLVNDRAVYEKLAETQILSFGLYHSVKDVNSLYTIDHTGVKHLTDINDNRMVVLKSVDVGHRVVVSVSEFFSNFKLS